MSGIFVKFRGTGTSLIAGAFLLIGSGAVAQGLDFLPEEEYLQIEAAPKHRAFLPQSVDLSSRFPRPGDQGEQSSCVGWAVGYAARSYYEGLDGNGVSGDASVASPAYIYNSINRVPKDCTRGSYIADALDLLRRGSLSMAEYPYSESRCTPPTRSETALADDFRIKDWIRVNHTNMDQIKGQLAQGHPVIIGMKSSPELHRVKAGEIYRGSGDTGEPIGHAMTVVGYDEARRAIKVINSWGEDWGRRGFGWISYDAFLREGREAYAMRPLEAGVDPEPRINIPVPPPSPVPFDPERPISPSEVTIADVGCGRVSVRREGNGYQVTGFVGSEEDVVNVREHFAGRDADIDLEIRPWPQCEVLLTLDEALSAAGRPVISLPDRRSGFKEGDTLGIEITTPPAPSFLHVAYVQADGTVVNLAQSENMALEAIDSGASLKFGDGQDGRALFTIGPPFGTEMIIAVSSVSPLFPSERPRTETEREFLTALRQALLASPPGADGERVVSAAYRPLLTKPNATEKEGEE